MNEKLKEAYMSNDYSNLDSIISKPETDEQGREFQMIGDKKIYSIEIKNEEDRKRNDAINRWRASRM